MLLFVGGLESKKVVFVGFGLWLFFFWCLYVLFMFVRKYSLSENYKRRYIKVGEMEMEWVWDIIDMLGFFL